MNRFRKMARVQSACRDIGYANRRRLRRLNRRGAVSSMDYFLVLAIILPLVLVVFRFAPRMIQLVYEMTIVIVGGPMM